MPRTHYSRTQEEEFLARAKRFMKENPDTNRTRIAMYAGVGVAVLERLEEEGRIQLPPVLTKTQKRMGVNWNKYLGNLSGR
jgi:hypothetical protein